MTNGVLRRSLNANISHEFYIESIVPRINRAADAVCPEFRSSWLGDWVYDKIMPRPDGTIYKMKTQKVFHAKQAVLNGQDVLNRFL